MEARLYEHHFPGALFCCKIWSLIWTGRKTLSHIRMDLAHLERVFFNHLEEGDDILACA